MFGKKIKLDPALYERLAKVAEAQGYASTDEFILHILDRAADAVEDAADEAEAEQQLRGLGYIE